MSDTRKMRFAGQRTAFALILAVAALTAGTRAQSTIDDLRQGFGHPPDDARIMMRWWWFGSAVTKPELEREMRLMKEGGIGGVEVQPVYPLLPDDPPAVRNLPFLSDGFIDALRFASDKARELGLRMDLTLGSGWPYGGPEVPISEAAGRLRCERVRPPEASRRVPLPSMTVGEKLLAVFAARVREKGIEPASLREVTDMREGVLWLPSGLEGPQEVMFFIASRTGMMVKRAAVGAEGFVLDHYDRIALDHYLKSVGDRLMQAFGSHPPHAVFCDSLEVFGSDWTGDFLQEFSRRRGYDLKPYLPALVVDIGEKTAAVRHDWGKTLTELANERFVAPLRGWASRNKTLLRIQCYGMPPVALSSNALVDLPEGEGAQWKILRASRWASSASHLYGRPITSSETWTWLHSPVFRATPLDIKAEADLHFLQGINQLIGHGWPYTAKGVDYPGWRFYAAGVFNDKNPWWLVMPDLAAYLQRISFMMRQGRPVNDVALYLPNSDAWSHFSAGQVHLIETLRQRLGPNVIARILESGFNLDFFDDEALEQLGRIEKGALSIGNNRYRIIILPGIESIPLSTYRKLEEFARNGGILVATRRLPAIAPGLKAGDAEQKEVRAISQRLFEGPSAAGRIVEDENRQLGTQLSSLHPDFSLTPPVREIGFVHRSTGTAEIYFIANTSNQPHRMKAAFRIDGMRPEWWDPLTGRTSPAAVLSQSDGQTVVELEIEPYGSRILVYSHVAPIRIPQARNTAQSPAPLDLSTGWKVTFGDTGRTRTMDKLQSWTDDEETRYYSGLATYERDLELPEDLLRKGLQVRLLLGEGSPLAEVTLKSGMQAWLDSPVREAAVIYVNEQRAGSVWCPPYEVNVTGMLRYGRNRFKAVVGNLAINYMAGRSLPDYRLLNSRYGVRFEPQDMDRIRPVPAGLLGPVTLVARYENRP